MVRILFAAVQAHFDLTCMIFYCYYFAKRFSFIESFEIRSSTIRNDVKRMKYVMKQEANRSNMKIVLKEPENFGEKFVCYQIFIQNDFHLSNMTFSFFMLFLRSVKRNQHFIQHGIFVMLDEMLDRFNKAFRKFLNIRRRKTICVKVSL